MNFFELLILAIGLSMDAFAVSVCKGLSLSKVTLKHMLIAGAWFGFFQAIMPAAGFLLGRFFSEIISHYAHIVAFFLLFIVGYNMLKEAFSNDFDEDDTQGAMDVRNMAMLAVATSIDALAVGVSFAALNVNLPVAVTFIGLITFLLSCAGVKIGSIFGDRYERKAKILGGAILVILGLKILIEGFLK